MATFPKEQLGLQSHKKGWGTLNNVASRTGGAEALKVLKTDRSSVHSL